MIIDRIENAPLYYGISEDIREALEFFRTHTGEEQPVQLSERVNVKILPYETKNDDERKWEAHEHLIDIHYAAKGSEDVCWANRADLVFTKKEEGKDVLRYTGEGTRFHLREGMFAIVFPDDVHKTKLNPNGTKETVLKGIAKIKI